MTNDALIAISARRYGVIVTTLNTKDFELIGEFYSFMLFGVTRAT
jgi:predicted nucleic acid-binding protein